MKITKEVLKQIIKEELENEAFGGRRSYGSGYRKEQDPNWHAAPGESFTAPGIAYQYFTTVNKAGETENRRWKFQFHSKRDLQAKAQEALEKIYSKYSDANAEANNGFVAQSDGKVEVISQPTSIEN